MNLGSYQRLIMDLRKTAQMARARPGDPFTSELCERKMLEAADKFEGLLRWAKHLDDDGK